MAFDLRAILRLDDQMSGPMRRVQREMQRSQRIMDQMRNSTNQAGSAANRTSSAFSSFGRTIGGAVKNMFSLRGGLIGLVGAYASVASAQKIFEATVGRAAEREQSTVMIKAMLGDDDLAKQYMEMVDRFALASPVLDSQTMYGNSKSFITATKDLGQLEKMWSLAERLAAIDPVQGLEGAVFSLRELFSGDAISMIQRFEMPRTIMNEIKKLPLEKQLARLDEYFTSIGMTQKLIDEMGSTTLGKWGAVKEKFSLILNQLGAPALDPLKKWMDDVMKRFDGEDFQRFGRIGGRIIENIISGLTSASTRVYDWFTNLINSPEWQERTTIAAKLTFVIDDLLGRFHTWMDEKGKDYLTQATKTLLEVGAVGLMGAQDTIIKAAETVGIAVGKALISSANNQLTNWIYEKMNSNWITKMNPVTIAANGTRWVKNKYFAETNNGGLDYVPYTNYPASLGKGEAILSRGEAEQWRSGKSGGGNNSYNFYFTPSAGSTQEQAKEMFDYFVREIEAAGGAGA